MVTIFSYGFAFCHGAALSTFGGTGKHPKVVGVALIKEAMRISSEGLSHEYFDLRKKAAYGSMIRIFDSFENVCINQASAYFNGCNMFELPEIFDSISLTDVVEFIKDNLTPERLAVSVIKPMKE